MKERPEDFDYGSAWKKLVEIADNTNNPYTNIERKLIRKQWKECQLQRDRKKLLAQIMQQTINPTTREDIEDGVISKAYAQNLARSMMGSQQALQGVIAGGFNNSRSVYQDSKVYASQGRVV
jgi:hypothetical protein